MLSRVVQYDSVNTSTRRCVLAGGRGTQGSPPARVPATFYTEQESESVRTSFAMCKGKAVPQQTYGGAGGRGGIAPTHSRPRH
jgi:hypothetical protein